MQLTFFDKIPSAGVCVECDTPFTYEPTYRASDGKPNAQTCCDNCLDSLAAQAELQFELSEIKRSRLPDSCRASYESECRAEPGTRSYQAFLAKAKG